MQTINELNALPATRIVNETQRQAACTVCQWMDTTKRAHTGAARHAAATGHRVRHITSRTTFYVRTARTDGGEGVAL